MLIIILSLLIHKGEASELLIKNFLLNYSITFDEKIIKIQDSAVSLSVPNQKCIDFSYQKILFNLRNIEKKLIPIEVNSDPLIMSANKKYTLRKNSEEIFYLKNIFDEIKKLKIEEELSCQ
jgi:hypothetical protein